MRIGPRMMGVVGCLAPALALALGVVGIGGSALAAAGDLDPTFGTGGRTVVAPPAGCQDVANAVRLAPDGKFVALGVACTHDFLVVQVLADGTPDPAFGQGGRVVTDVSMAKPPVSCGAGCIPAIPSPSDDSAADAVVLPDGRIVVGGTTGNGTAFALVRYKTDGALDTSFGSGGTVTTDVSTGYDTIAAVLLQPDGKLVAVGRADDGFAIVRYTADGAADPTFGTDGVVRAAGVLPAGAVLDTAGRIVAVGITGIVGPFDFILTRYLPDGRLDTSFGTGGAVTADSGRSDFPRGIALAPDGKILVAGGSSDNTSSTFGLARFLPDGAPDTGFGTAGWVVAGPSYAEARAVAVQPDGRILVAGTSYVSNFAGNDVALARYQQNGAADPTFGTNGVLLSDPTTSSESVAGVVLPSADRAVVAGTMGTGQVFLARYLAPPTPIPTPPTTPTTTTPVRPPRYGYWMVGVDGAVYAFGDATWYGSALVTAGRPAVDIEPSRSGNGYWVVDDLGRVSRFGDAPFIGSLGPGRLAGGETVTSLSATRSGSGYWLFTSRGRVFPFGDAASLGDMSAIPLNGAVVDSVTTPSGNGYFMVGKDGGIFSFGDATFRGSRGGQPLNAPVLSLVPDTSNLGYWLVAADGGIFAYGDAPFMGSMGATRLNRPVTGMVRAGRGYLMVAEDGGIFDFSGTPGSFQGSLGNRPPANPITAVALLDER